ncbi:Calx-beta domain-containing protein [Azospirillum sp.]|uniref:Calx-beta domain-containing protein n=1 Tax=Azospirillum sp. TaxID=34012 RepID=UPI002D5CCF3B|nr:Calx-beta domain-containing protein [Azospirillum sp.]HYD68571.1 Calx-beta domain-containing protein [Azospirillum sp.]
MTLTYSIGPATVRQTEDSGFVPTAFTFIVTRSGDVDTESTVDWAVSEEWGSGAADYNDFIDSWVPSGTVTFMPGETSQTITIEVIGDDWVEPDESFSVILSNPSEGDIDTAEATAVILNDEGVMTVSVVDAAKTEGNTGTTPFTFTVTRDGPADTEAWAIWYATIDGTAGKAAASDFAGGVQPTGTVTFQPGETAQTITVFVAGDTLTEGNEAFEVRLANLTEGSASPTSATATILNDDVASSNSVFSITATDLDKAEGSGGQTPFTFTVTRTNATAVASVKWAAAGLGPIRATLSDFANDVMPSGTLSFAIGETSKTVTLQVAGDTYAEGDEGFSVTLSNPTGGTLGTVRSANGVIRNDDTSYAIYTLDGAVQEGNEGTTPFTFLVTRSGVLSGSGSVDWEVEPVLTDLTDFAGGVLPTGSLSFAPGETQKTIVIDVAGDTVLEDSEEFFVKLTNAVGGMPVGWGLAGGFIINDDVATRYSISPGNVDLGEGDDGSTPFTFSVSRGTSTGVSSVDWAVTSEFAPDAADASDFSGGFLPSGTVTFADGETQRSITVFVAGDTTVEGSERFSVGISNASDGGVIDQPSASGLIINDDASFAVTALSADAAEGDADSTPFTFTISRNALSIGTSSVDWAVTSDSAADGADFAGGGRPNGTVTFGPGETSKTITVAVAGDATVEADEGFTVQLSNATGTIVVGSATGTIRNDDTSLSVAASSTDKLETDKRSTAPFTFTVTRSGVLDGTSSASWSVAGSGGSPADATDFTDNALPNGTVTFAAGEASKTITVAVAGDNKKEPDEGFTLTLSNASGATIGNASATGTILNDDGPDNHRTVPSTNFPAFGTAMAAFGLSNPAADDTGFVFTTAGGTLDLASGTAGVSVAAANMLAPWRQADSGYAILGGA